MKKYLTVLLLSLFVLGCTKQISENSKQKEYFGQTPPSGAPQLFAPGFVSTGLDEFNATFSPDGKEFYFSVRSRWDFLVILVSKYENGEWTKPKNLPFSGIYRDADPFITKDGNLLYFCSDRPVDAVDTTRDWNIWVTERNGKSWGDPKPLPFNTGKNEMYVSVANNGNVYFHADYTSKNEQLDLASADLYYSKFENGKYLPAEKLEWAQEISAGKYDPYVDADENFIVYTAVLPGGYGSGDLYISRKTPEGKWDDPVNLGKDVNSAQFDYCPNISPDGKYFFYSSYRRNPAANGDTLTYDKIKDMLLGPNNGGGNVYWADIRILDKTS